MSPKAKRAIVAAMAVALWLGAGAPAAAAGWRTKLDRLLSKYDAGMAVVADGTVLYSHRAGRSFPLASNQKLLLTMALFDALGPDARLATTVLGARSEPGVVRDGLWVVGGGDPSIVSRARRYSFWGFPTTSVRDIARRIRDAGIAEVRGGVIGSTSGFARDWDARGWKPYVPYDHVALPTALVVDANIAGRQHTVRPERRFARLLAAELRSLGVRVAGRARAAAGPPTGEVLARVRSAPLWRITGYMNRDSVNFFAEVLGKLLGRHTYGGAGSIAKGARAIAAWVQDRGYRVASFDASGLSYRDAMAPGQLAWLLHDVGPEPWSRRLRLNLPYAGQGTLANRLRGLRVRAKTGTHYNGDSALSGWVRLHNRRWAAFSILSRDVPKWIEDEALRIVAASARLPNRRYGLALSRALAAEGVSLALAGDDRAMDDLQVAALWDSVLCLSSLAPCAPGG